MLNSFRTLTKKEKNDIHPELKKNQNSLIGKNSLWKAMHYVTSWYPENPTNEEKYWMNQFLESIGYILDCHECKSHYKTMFYEGTPIALNNKYELFQWLVDRHNEVNIRLGKRFMPVEEAWNCYHGGEEFCGNNFVKENEKMTECKTKQGFSILIGIILFSIFLVLVSYYFKK